MQQQSAHEIFHHRVWLRTKSEDEVTKGEEVFCDLASVELMQEAGYAPDAVLTALREVFHSKVSSIESLLAHLDPHPQTKVIDRLVENTIVAVRRKYAANYNRETTPVDLRLANLGARGKEYSDTLSEKLNEVKNISESESRFDSLIKIALDESKNWPEELTHRRSALLKSILDCGFDKNDPNLGAIPLKA